MFARVNTFEGPVDRIDANLEADRVETLPRLDRIDGYAGILVLLQRETGKSIAITFWESEAAMQASEAAANDLRNTSASRNGERIVSVERFEVGVSVLRPPVGA